MKKILTEKRILWFIIILAAATLVIIIFLTINTQIKEQVTTYSMGSYVEQTVYGKTAKDAAAVAANSIAELQDRISWKEIGGDIERLNSKAGGAWTKLDQTAYLVLETALDVAYKSNGAFDPTIAPISLLWNFDNSPTAPPEDELIQKFIKNIDYKNVKLEADTFSALINNTGFSLDLGAIGKGAACDTAIAVYKEKKVDAAIIAVGGSIGIYGTKSDNSLWNVAVRDPKNEISLGSLSLDSGFISTSGSYERYFLYKGKQYHHLIDPKTGYPAESELISVTIVCDNGAISDALSTACFVLGMEKSKAVLAEYSAEAIFIDTENRITLTDGLKDKFTLNSKDYTINE